MDNQPVIDVVVPSQSSCQHDWYCVQTIPAERLRFYQCEQCDARGVAMAGSDGLRQSDIDWLFEGYDMPKRFPWLGLVVSLLVFAVTAWFAGWWG